MTRAFLRRAGYTRRSVTWSILAIGCAVHLTCLALPARGADACANPYFPISPTLKLEYRSEVELGDTPPTNYTQTFTNITSDGFTQHLKFPDWELDRHWKCTPKGLVSTEYVSLTAPQRRTQLELKNTGGISIPPAAEWKKGLNWEYTYEVKDRAPSEEHGETTGSVIMKFEVAERESVTVPAGKFDAVKVYMIMKQDLSVVKGGETFPMNNVVAALLWYAKDVGLVKATSEAAATTELVSVTK